MCELRLYSSLRNRYHTGSLAVTGLGSEKEGSTERGPLSPYPCPQFHVDKKGRVNFAQTELLIHVVNRDTNRILDVDRWVEVHRMGFKDPG